MVLFSVTHLAICTKFQNLNFEKSYTHLFTRKVKMNKHAKSIPQGNEMLS